MKRFFTYPFQAITDLQFYQQTLPKLSILQSLGYFIVFYIVVGGIAAFYWLTTRLPEYQTGWTQTTAELSAQLPEQLELQWSGQVLQSSPSAVVIAYPTVWQLDASTLELPDALLQLDTKQNGTATQSAVVSITAREMRIWQQERESETIPLTELLSSEAWQITGQQLKSIVPQATAFGHQLLNNAYWIYPPLHIFSVLITRILQASVAAVVLSLVSKVTGIPLSVAAAFKLLLWIFIPAELVVRFTQIGLGSTPPSLFSLSVLAYYFCIVWSNQPRIISR